VIPERLLAPRLVNSLVEGGVPVRTSWNGTSFLDSNFLVADLTLEGSCPPSLFTSMRRHKATSPLLFSMALHVGRLMERGTIRGVPLGLVEDVE
jgi:hypothetical protein